MRKRLVIVGAGGHAKSVISCIDDSKFELLGLYDDSIKGRVVDYQILGTTSQLLNDFNSKKFDVVFIAIGSNIVRKTVISKLGKELESVLVNIVSRNAIVSKSSKFLGSNNLIGHFAYVGPCATIGSNNIINTGAIFEHDSVMGNDVTIATNATVNGGCTIGDLSQISTSSTVIEGIRIGSEIVVAAGAVVINDLVEKGLYTGVPATFKK